MQMKKIIYIITFILFINEGFAQSFKAEQSVLFNDNIGVPVLLMKNGNTVFQNSDENKKMYLTIFDKDHKAIVIKKQVAFKKAVFFDNPSPEKKSNILNWIELNGKIALYLKSGVKAFKVTVDPTTGNVEDEAEMPALQFEKEGIYGSVCTEEKSANGDYKFIRACSSTLEKDEIDPTTGNYLQINSTRKFLSAEQAAQHKNFDDIQTYEVKIFNHSNQEIQTIKLDYIDKKYNSASNKAILFDNNVIYFVMSMSKIIDRVTYDGGEETVYFSKYDLGTKKFTHTELFKTRTSIAGCTIFPNKDNTFFNLKFISEAGTKDYQVFYDIFFIPFDATNFTAGKKFNLSSDKLNTFVKSNCNMSEGYGDGMMDKFFVDKEGNITTSRIKNVLAGSSLTKGVIYTVDPELIGVSRFDKAGNEIGGWAYPWKNKGIPLGVFEIKNNFAYTIASGSQSNFIFLNDLTDNYNLPLDKKHASAKLIEDCNAMAIELTSSGVKQYYLFGPPNKGKESNQYIDFTNILYDEKTNTLIVRVYEGPGCKKTHAAWIKID